jgi:glycosyltransferase involved in cell wall biosynthesis
MTDVGEDGRWRQQNGARVLCRDPLIVTGTTLLGRLPIGPPPLLSPLLSDRPMTYLVRASWQVETPAKVAEVAEAHRRHRASHPDHRVVMIVNAVREALRLERAGVPAFVGNHNAFVDERTFAIDASAEKRFDAIYNARLAPYKRHGLAAAIPSLALIHHVVQTQDRPWSGEVRRMLPQAFFVNQAEAERAIAATASARARAVAARLLADGAAPPIPAAEVAAWLNRARVGLCLSRTEGGMHASIEYLLCGLPVVSTASLGGRDRYFDPDHTRIVDDDPAAVAAAVAELAAARIDAREIRAAALAMMRVDRRAFVDFVQELIDEAGGRMDFAARFPALLAGGLYPETAIADLAAEARG